MKADTRSHMPYFRFVDSIGEKARVAVAVTSYSGSSDRILGSHEPYCERRSRVAEGSYISRNDFLISEMIKFLLTKIKIVE